MRNTINPSKLTDDELVRLDWKIWRKMRKGYEFGIDRPTMKIIHPHLLQWLDAVRMTRGLRGV